MVKMYKFFFKRLLDFIVSLILLVLLSPIFLMIFIVLFFITNGSPFFLQKRPGLNTRIFCIIKFKTMKDIRDSSGKLLPDAERLTLIGKFIRKTSLDELPQLINVLKGEMSLVGPRPLLVEYLEIYNQNHNRRHNVRPGITGWAQINGRNNISWNEKLNFDVWYVDNFSFFLDLKILFLTFLKVIKSEGVSKTNQATTNRFNGNN